MCGKNVEGAEDRAKKSSEKVDSQSERGCPCEPGRCLPFAGALLAAVTVPLVIRTIQRSRQSKSAKACGREPAGCCA